MANTIQLYLLDNKSVVAKINGRPYAYEGGYNIVAGEQNATKFQIADAPEQYRPATFAVHLTNAKGYSVSTEKETYSMGETFDLPVGMAIAGYGSLLISATTADGEVVVWLPLKIKVSNDNPNWIKNASPTHIQIGKTITLPAGSEAKVTNRGTLTDPIFDFEIPQGPQGEEGEAATIEIGKVMTAAPSADAQVENVGTRTHAVLNITIPQGKQGESFSIVKVYSSIEEMDANFATDGVKEGKFVIISTPNVDDPDNSKLFVKGATSYGFITDMSGAQGIQGLSGRGIASTDIDYALSVSGRDVPDIWDSSIPAIEAGKYLWTRTVTNYTDDTSTTAYTVAYQGTDGQGAVTSVNGETGAVQVTPESIGAVAESGTYADLIAGKALSAMYGFAEIASTLPSPVLWHKLLSFPVTATDGSHQFRTMGGTFLYRDIYQGNATGLLIIKIRTIAGGAFDTNSKFQIMPITSANITADNFRVTFDISTWQLTLWFKGTLAYQNMVVTQISQDHRSLVEIPNITYYSTSSGKPVENTTTTLPGDVYEFTENAFFTSSGGNLYGNLLIKKTAPTIALDNTEVAYNEAVNASKGNQILFRDKNNQNIGKVSSFIMTTDNRVQIAVKNKHNTDRYVDFICPDDTTINPNFSSYPSNAIDLGSTARKWKEVYATTYHGSIEPEILGAYTTSGTKTITGLANYKNVIAVLLGNGTYTYSSIITTQRLTQANSASRSWIVGGTYPSSSGTYVTIIYEADNTLTINGVNSSRQLVIYGI